MSYLRLRADTTAQPADGAVPQYNATTKVWDLSAISTTNIFTADGTFGANRTATLDAAKTLTFDITGTGSIAIADGGTAFVTFADGGTTTLTNDIAVNGGDVTTTATTATLFNTNATTLNIGGAATTVGIGAGTGNTTVNNNLVVTGNLDVNGTTTTIDTATLQVEDNNIELNITGGTVNGNDTTADGGGFTIRSSDSNKTFNWVNATDAFTSSEHIALAAGKTFIVNGSTSGAVTVDAPATVTDYTLTFPAAAPTANGQVLSATTAGDATWVDQVADTTIRTETAATTLVDGDKTILLNSTTALVTLPDPSTITAGKHYTVICIAATPTTAGVDTATAATISGSASFVFATQYESVTVVTDGTQYYVV